MSKFFFPLAVLTLGSMLLPAAGRAASCKTQSQMTAAQRDALSLAAHSIMSQVQSGNETGLRAGTLPSVAADFSGIAASVESLKPLVQQAAITVDSLYLMDATGETQGHMQFFCGSPVVVLNFNDLPPGSYALAIVHATGVTKPQQVALILAESADHRWLLGGFFAKPMTEAGHDGLFYWTNARKYAQKNMGWDAWFYYRLAADVLNPVDFLSSPNLEKLQDEQQKIKPNNLPQSNLQPVAVSAHGTTFQVTSVDPTITFGPLDLEVHYAPDPAEAAQLRDPPAARRQVTQLMTALIEQHPDLPAAFHGIWVQADGPSASLFSLELPMDQIVPGTGAAFGNATPARP